MKMHQSTVSSLTSLLVCAGFTAATVTTASAAAIVTESFTTSTSVLIPDDDASGVLQMVMPGTSIGVLDHVSLTINTTAGWNGDLYAYLWHNGNLAVVVNRPGRSASAPDGSATSGLSITLDDMATMDIHSIPLTGAAVTGSFQPDGRNIDPLYSLVTTPRTQTLSSFAGGAASGEWRLFVADVATGEQATLTSWTITLTGETVIPEPSSSLLMAATGLLLVSRRRRA